MPDKSEEFSAGEKAGFLESGRDTNPYPVGTVQHKDWDDGYFEGDQYGRELLHEKRVAACR